MKVSALVLFLLLLYTSANAEILYFQKSEFRGQGSFGYDFNPSSLPNGCQLDTILSCPEGFTLNGNFCYSNYYKSIVIYKYKCDTSESIEQVENDEYQTFTYSTTSESEIINVAENIAMTNFQNAYCPSGSVYLGSVHMYQIEAAPLSNNNYTAVENVITRAYCRINGTGSGTNTETQTDDYSISGIKQVLLDKINALKDNLINNLTYRDVSVDEVPSITLYGRSIYIDITSVPYISTIANGIYYMIMLFCVISLMRL